MTRYRAFWAAIAMLVIIGLAVPTFFHIEVPPEPLPPEPLETNAIWTQHTASGTPYSGFLYKSCAETFSFGYTWFSNLFNIVCDTPDRSPLCNLRVKSTTGYSSLGEKALHLWKLVQQSPEAADIVLKLDDDTIIQKHVLDNIIDDFAQKPCVLSGLTWKHIPGQYYWPLGRLYLFKKSALPPPDSPKWYDSIDQFKNAEDVQMGYLINVTDPHLFCELDPSKFWHAAYEETSPGWDKRVEIKFRYLSSTCEKPRRSWFF